ncbi:MAG: class I SAM-dependent methyltransferase [Sphingosinicella sp.]|uniref:class I SAM-dependent methyltransferase n=1 Tax=Sphingosinicella sp. TaxID=1917971 RepID=UPI0040376ABC
MSTDRHEHWNRVYTEKDPTSVSWFQPEPEPSLRALDRLGAQPSSSLIDVGGGASTLIDALLMRGWRDVTVLDIAPSALDRAKARLGGATDNVVWEVADVTTWHPTRRYDVWHDRAVFHFLVQPEQRAAYREALAGGLAKGGLVVVATFALDGPERCSGLPVERYDADKLARELGPSIELVEAWREEHVTPWGATQAFTWCAFRSS